MINNNTLQGFLYQMQKNVLCMLSDLIQKLHIFETVHFESCFPVYYVTRKHKTNDWITTDIWTSCKRKGILYILSKISNCPVIKSFSRYYCSTLQKVIRNAKAGYNNIISSAENKSKTSWNILRKEIGKLDSNINISTLFKIDNIILNTRQFSNEFNNYLRILLKQLSRKIQKLFTFHACPFSARFS